MTINEVKRWKCRNGHVLGVVNRVRATTQSGRSYHVSRLMLYREAIGAEADMAEVDVIAVIEGTALDIRCSICGEIRPWYMGADALERLIETIRR